MTYEVYLYIFYGGLIASGIFLAIAVILFFVFKIPDVIGDLSGATARRGIENIRSKNEDSGTKTYKSSPVNVERGKLTDKISPSGTLMQRNTDVGAMATEKISTQQLSSNETTVLDQVGESGETTVLGTGDETTILGQSANVGETTVLDGMTVFGAGNETTVLSQDMYLGGQTNVGVTSELGTDGTGFVIEQEITFIHSDEIIS